MRKIAEVLRLHHECGRSQREIAVAVGASPTTVGEYLRRAKSAGIGYPTVRKNVTAAFADSVNYVVNRALTVFY